MIQLFVGIKLIRQSERPMLTHRPYQGEVRIRQLIIFILFFGCFSAGTSDEIHESPQRFFEIFLGSDLTDSGSSR